MLARDYARAMREELHRQNNVVCQGQTTADSQQFDSRTAANCKDIIEVTADEWLKIADRVESLAEMEVEHFRNLVVHELEERALHYQKEARKYDQFPDIQHHRRLQEYSYKNAMKIVDSVFKTTVHKEAPKEAQIETQTVSKENCEERGRTDNYEVAFVVEGYITNPDTYIGESIECNGTDKRIEDFERRFYLKDGRAYYNVQAENPLDAFNKGETYFEADDFGGLEITRSCLEHVSLGDRYWYEEDLDKAEIDTLG